MVLATFSLLCAQHTVEDQRSLELTLVEKVQLEEDLFYFRLILLVVTSLVLCIRLAQLRGQLC